MAYLNEDGEWVLGESDGKTEDTSADRDENGCLILDPTTPYKPLCFQPSSESCVIPNVIEQCSRVEDEGYVYKSVNVGEKYAISMEWQYHNGTEYVATTNVANMTVDGYTSSNLPRAKFTIYDVMGVELEEIYDFHYIRVTLNESTGGISTTDTHYHNAHSKAIPSLNGSAYVNLPNEDNIGDVQDPIRPKYIRHREGDSSPSNMLVPPFVKINTTFYLPIDGITTVTEIEDPSLVRTGPTQTVGYISVSEKDNNKGIFEPINKQIRYNYVTSLWEDL